MSAGHLDDAAISEIASMTDDPELMKSKISGYPLAASQFLDPTGATIENCTALDLATNELKDGQSIVTGKEAILMTEMDLNECIEGKQYHDVVGGYQRFDVFSLQVNRQRYEPVVFRDSPSTRAKPSKMESRKAGTRDGGEADHALTGDETVS
jgi:nitrilase